MKNILSLLFVLYVVYLPAQITLTHNVGNAPITTGMQNCEYEEEWARVFELSDFGITTNEQFIIKSGEVAISNSYDGASIGFSVYSIDSGFPVSTSNYLGGSNVLAPYIGDTPEIVGIDFINPIVIPAGIEKILVVVTQSDDIYNPEYREVLIAGTQEDNDVSWFRGCREYYSFVSTENLSEPVPDANFFINVTGEKFYSGNFGASTTLTHNICDQLVETSMFSCSYSKIYWARLFDLEDFGVSTNEEMLLTRGQVGVGGSNSGTAIKFNIYEVDDNFPDSFSEMSLIGSSQEHRLPYVDEHYPQIINVDFETPILIPKDAKKILVEVENIIYWGSGVFFLAGTEQDRDDSWFRGCGAGSPGYSMANYVTMVDPAFRKPGGYPDAKFFINVSGEVNHVTNNFEINISNICSEFLKEFNVENRSDVASVIWNFGDPASGADNLSTDISPFHDFSTDGVYTITANVMANDGRLEILTETITVREPPSAYGIDNLESCEDVFGTGFSSSFDTSNIRSEVLGSQTGRVVTFIDETGNEYDLLPNPFFNSIKDRETITVRVSRQDELCCYSEITFDLIVNPKPDLSSVQDVYACDDDSDGYTYFDLSKLRSDLSTNNTIIDFYFEDGQQIPNSQLSAVINTVQYEENITLRITNTLTNCYSESNFKLVVNPLPITNPLTDLIGCDDNGDGISEHFDISNVQSEALGNQTGMDVTFYDSSGNLLPNPLPNPYTNSIANQETITVRVTNTQTACYAEAPLILRTSDKPQINKPKDRYACDEGGGQAYFNLSSIKQDIIGNQSNLNIHYYNSDGSDITNAITSSFQNTKAWEQTIYVKVENAMSNLCVSETEFKLFVNELPQVDIDDEYFLCNLEPSLSLSVDSSFDFYQWNFEDGTVISNGYDAILVNDGEYTLKIGEIKNGISCENTYSFNLIRSILPKIENVEHQELSDNNYITINASGDGDFEYSIDGETYQIGNTFNNVLGGVYTVYVRDKFGCGQDSQEVIVIDYPKYFTPNNDGVNDTWQIRGIERFQDAIIYIYDRYGKLLKQVSPKSNGWNGTFNGNVLDSSDYWFTVDFDGKQKISGHFTLKK